MTGPAFSPHAEAWFKLITRIVVSACGFGIAVWGIHDIIVTDRLNPVPPPVAHYIIVGLVILIGLGVSGGKKTLDVLSAITGGIRAWKSGGQPPAGPTP